MSTAGDKRVVIIGGGISGLTAAWRLHRASVPFLLLESSDRFGGMIRTDRVDGYTLELGADAILMRKPWAHQLAVELGMHDRILPINRPPRSTYVLHRGKPVPLPDGLALLVPSNWRAFLASPLFSTWGKARAAMDLVIPRRRETTDETLASFVTRRLGREMLETVADPMLAGVFNGEAQRQSMLATFPQFPALEREHGSLIRGMRAKRSPAPNPQERPFFSFKAGAQELPQAIADRLDASSPGSLRLNTSVDAVGRSGDGYSITLSSGETMAASALIVATPAAVAARILQHATPDAAALLAQIRYTGIGTAYVAYRREDVPHPLDGFGVVIPSRERRSIDGMMWSTTKWDGRAPAGQALIRVFFGGPHTRSIIDLTDDALRELVRRELADTLGVRAEPLLWRVHRWPAAYPQYDLGHLERVAAIEAALPPGLLITGNAYRGVGVPDCVRQASEAAAKVLTFLKKEHDA